MTNALEVIEARAHALFSPSSAYRWLVCAKFPTFTQHMPNLSSWAAAEGTVAHTVGEVCHEHNIDAAELIGHTYISEVQGVSTPFTVTLEMANAVQHRLNWARGIELALDCEVLVEQRVSLDALNPASPIAGTLDLGLYVPRLRTLKIADYKHGAGMLVEIRDNPQLKIYGVGGILDLAQKRNWAIDFVETTIIQPRAEHPMGPIRSHTYGVEELLTWAADEVVPAVARGLDPEAEFTPGEHCKWCPAESGCPGRAAAAQSVIPIQFLPALPQPIQLTFEQRVEILDKLDSFAVQEWIGQLRWSVQLDLAGGAKDERYKLVEKRGTRAWALPDELIAQTMIPLLKKGRDVTELYEPPVLKSPAQVEKVTKKALWPAGIAPSVSSGFNLVRSDNAKPGIDGMDASDEFDAITPYDEDLSDLI